MSTDNVIQTVVILCSRLDVPGGIERAVVQTANLLQGEGHCVTLLVLDETNGSFYPLHKDVRLVQKNLDFGIAVKGNPLTRKIRLYKHVRKLSSIFSELKPNVIIGTEYALTIAAYAAPKNVKTKIFAWEHHHFHWLGKSRFWQFLFQRIYPRLDAVICLNPTEQSLYRQAGCKTVVIPNFVSKHTRSSLDTKILLSVGWVIDRKGFDLIPAIAKNVFAKHPDWRWKIIGTGKEEAVLKSEIAKQGLANFVEVLPPRSADMESIYRCASLYVMTSRFECFPMVLLEAMSHGIPCLSFDCPTGPAFIITDKVDGLLLGQNDTNAMAEAICDLILDETKRIAFGDAAFQNIARFSPANVYALWRKVLAE